MFKVDSCNFSISSLDNNYTILKKEFNNLYNESIKLNDSLNNYINSIKDLHLNSNGFFNNIIKNNYSIDQLYGYSETLLKNFEQLFNEWLTNEKQTLNSILGYCQRLDDIRFKIQQLDSLELILLNSEQDEMKKQQYSFEKDYIFQQVKYCFDNKYQEFDINIINISYSFSNLFEYINGIYKSSSNNYLSTYEPNKVNNPITNLQPLNVFNNIVQFDNNILPPPPQQRQHHQQVQREIFNEQTPPLRPAPVPKELISSSEDQQQKQSSPVRITSIPINKEFYEQTPPLRPLRPAPIPKEVENSFNNQNDQQISIPRPLRPAPIPNDINTIDSQNSTPRPLRPAPIPNVNSKIQTSNIKSKPPVPVRKFDPQISQEFPNSNNELNESTPRPSRIAPTPKDYHQPSNTKPLPQIPNKLDNDNIISNIKYLKSDPWMIPKDSKLHPTIDQLMFDHETHSKMWNRYFKLNKIYKYKIRFIHKRSIQVEEGKLNSVKYYWYKPQSFQFQDIVSSTCKLVDDVTGKTIESIEIPTCLYNAYKLEYKSPPPNSKYTLYHITESNLYSNELGEIQPNESINQCEPISEKEIKIYTRCEREVQYESQEFSQFIDQYKLYPLKLKDGSIETTICFAYRVSLFIYKHITYNINSKSQLPLVTFSKKTANCESFSNLFSSILRYNNIPCRIVSGISIDKDNNNTYGRHAQTEFYVNNIGWIPYNGAARDCHVYNKFAFGKNNGDLFVQEAHSITDMEYGSGKFLSIIHPASTFSYSSQVKWGKAIESLDLEKLDQV